MHPQTIKGFHPFKKKGCSSSPLKMDHGVAVVGYGTDEVGGDYWIIRNSCESLFCLLAPLTVHHWQCI
jgi:hypothetical protein|eukprot:COSAG02_NODE_5026_length_4718_cov_3.432994_2_plen_68_part_00